MSGNVCFQSTINFLAHLFQLKYPNQMVILGLPAVIIKRQQYFQHNLNLNVAAPIFHLMFGACVNTQMDEMKSFKKK
jgi:hypothetical protein